MLILCSVFVKHIFDIFLITVLLLGFITSVYTGYNKNKHQYVDNPRMRTQNADKTLVGFSVISPVSMISNSFSIRLILIQRFLLSSISTYYLKKKRIGIGRFSNIRCCSIIILPITLSSSLNYSSFMNGLSLLQFGHLV